MTSAAVRFVREAPRQALMGLVRAYRLFISPALAASCRFEPSCSAYALGALDAHGAAAGTYLALRRVLRCGPWCEGGHDPVPDRIVLPQPCCSEDVPRPGASASSFSSPTASPHP